MNNVLNASNMEGTSTMTVTSHSSEDSSCISDREQDTDTHNDVNTSGAENSKTSKRRWMKEFFKLSKSPSSKSNQSLGSIKSNQNLVSSRSDDNGNNTTNDYSFVCDSSFPSAGLSRSTSVKEFGIGSSGSQRLRNNNTPCLAPSSVPPQTTSTSSSSSSESSSSYDSIKQTENSIRFQKNNQPRFTKENPQSRESSNMNSASVMCQYNVDTQATAIMSDMQKEYESQQLESLFINETLLVDPNGKVSEVIKSIFKEVGYKYDSFNEISILRLLQEIYQLIKKNSSARKSKLLDYASKIKEKEAQVKSQNEKIVKLETTNKAYKTKYKEISLENRKIKEAFKELDSESYDHDEELSKKYKYTKETLDRVNREQQLVVDQNEFLKKSVNELQNEVSATNFKFSLFKEKYAKLADSITELNTSTKKREALGENLTFECNELKEICLKYKKNIENISNTNKNLQSSFKNERKKVLDLRNERNLLKKEILLIECHGSYSLLLVSNILTCYRFLLPSETIIETESLIKELLNMNNSLSSHVSSSDQSPAEFSKELESKCIEFEEKLLYFYQEVVTKKIIDIIYKCFINYYKKSRQNDPKPNQNSATPYKQTQIQVPHSIK
ncbi:spo21p [Saccharomyces arboricola H-6]|uniref:Spo21p n=1 Tax=Saccharomyces arboricola (strain H-6 / AS 2.3317 / CBS 10644) TaxID=1160507 RepID=J8LIG1_SACAR|nr:spo21p [Saccharomyces arboricola H-6]